MNFIHGVIHTFHLINTEACGKIAAAAVCGVLFSALCALVLNELINL